MRKQTKIAAILSAASLLVMGASMTTFAAAGWTEENGTWVYYDKEGYKVTDTWKKSGDYWYFLDEDGQMALEKLIENSDDNNNIFYVDETGRMVSNRWVELDNEEHYDSYEEEEAETVWYYFQNSGKAYKANDGSGEGSAGTSFKTINGKKYAFNENGHMLYGWISSDYQRLTGDEAYKEGVYYCGDADDGARITNEWKHLYISQPTISGDDGNYWFYFGNNGKKYATGSAFQAFEVPAEGKKINGKYYSFDENGVMQSEWHDSAIASEGKASTYYGYYSDGDNGARAKGWFKVVPDSVLNSTANTDDEAHWYYAQNNGKLYANVLKTINGKKYAFGENGEMLNGLVDMTVDSGNHITINDKLTNASDIENIESFDAVYYFGTEDDGAMKTGNQTVEVDGESYQFSFGKNGSTKGQGLNDVQSNVLYVNGKRIKADSDYKYQAVNEDGIVQTLSEGESMTGYLVNTSGTVMKGSGQYKDSEGRIYTVKPIGSGDDAGQYTVTFQEWNE